MTAPPTVGLLAQLDIDRRVMANAAADLNGTTQYLTGAHITLPASWHVVMYAALRDVALHDGYLIAQYGAAGNREFRLRQDADGLHLRVSSTGTATTLASVDISAKEDIYTMFDAFHEDGVEIGIGMNHLEEANTAPFVGGVFNGTAPLTIGANSVGPSQWADARAGIAVIIDTTVAGKLSDDDLAWFFNGGLYRGADEIAARFGADVVALWPLHEASGQRSDVSGNAHHLTSVNGVGVADGPISDDAVTFDGAANAYVLPATAGMEGTPFTIVSVAETATVDSTVRAIISKYDAGANNRVWRLITRNGDLEFNVSEDGLFDDTFSSIASGIQAGVPFLAVARYTQGETTRVSVDGGSFAASTGTPGALHAANITPSVGCNTSAGVAQNWWWNGAQRYTLFLNLRITVAQRTWLANGGAFRSVRELIEAAANGVGDGKDIWPAAEFCFVNGVDIIADLALTKYGTTGIQTGVGEVDVLQSDVSPEGVDLDGALVRSQQDQSGSDRHATAPSLSRQVTYDKAAATLRNLDGTRGLEIAYGSTLPAPVHAVVRGEFDSLNDNNVLFSGREAANNHQVYAATTGGFFNIWAGGNLTTEFTQATGLHTFAALFNSTLSQGRVNGVDGPVGDANNYLSYGVVIPGHFNHDRGSVQSMRALFYSVELTGQDLLDAEDYVENGDVLVGLSGTATIETSASGDLTSSGTEGVLEGTASVGMDVTGVLTGNIPGALVGTVEIRTAVSGDLTTVNIEGFLVGSTSQETQATGNLTGFLPAIGLVGTLSMSTTVGGALSSTLDTLSGQADLELTVQGNLLGVNTALLGTAQISTTVSGDLTTGDISGELVGTATISMVVTLSQFQKSVTGTEETWDYWDPDTETWVDDMTGVKSHDFIIGAATTIEATLRKDGGVFDLTGWEVRVQLRNLDTNALSDVNTADNVDWIHVEDRVGGVIQITIPSDLNAPVEDIVDSESQYRIGAMAYRVVDNQMIRFGDAIYRFLEAPEGLPLNIPNSP